MPNHTMKDEELREKSQQVEHLVSSPHIDFH